MKIMTKLESAKRIIQNAIDIHGHKIYVSYSGGKDSKALVKLTKEVYGNNLLIIHNGHVGEKVEDTHGILVVKKPKENVQEFLKLVELEAQLDGTRRDEDKTVMFDGKEIHRSEMPTFWTGQGVFGLTVYFPFMDWTEEEIYEYLNS
jgi:3'-phosphoadenosine 5'-phosphosulfate sulfotransferase (PAPS reductase)/FAD synthetase